MQAQDPVVLNEGGRRVRCAVVGCTHGSLDKVYEAIQTVNQSSDHKVDLLLCCGDFQAVRNEKDLECLACPAKYRSMCDFHKYYSGRTTAPIPTVFIGGNHEASNLMQELYYGGFVAPNIYYMGAAGVVQFGGLRIGGISGEPLLATRPPDFCLVTHSNLPFTGAVAALWLPRHSQVF